MHTQAILLLTSLVILSSCSKGSDSKSSPAAPPKAPEEQPRQEEVTVPETINGLYHAEIFPLNEGIAGSSAGFVDVSILGDEVTVESTMSAMHPESKHFQKIHVGTACPTIESDKNADGVIDPVEGGAIYGQSLIPLDSNLDGQILGMTYGPISNETGSYVYKRSTFLSKLEADLRMSDPFEDDQMTKLAEGEKFRLVGKAIVIYGIAHDTLLPDTVAEADGLPRQVTLPIACGILQKK